MGSNAPAFCQQCRKPSKELKRGEPANLWRCPKCVHGVAKIAVVREKLDAAQAERAAVKRTLEDASEEYTKRAAGPCEQCGVTPFHPLVPHKPRIPPKDFKYLVRLLCRVCKSMALEMNGEPIEKYLRPDVHHPQNPSIWEKLASEWYRDPYET